MVLQHWNLNAEVPYFEASKRQFDMPQMLIQSQRTFKSLPFNLVILAALQQHIFTLLHWWQIEFSVKNVILATTLRFESLPSTQVHLVRFKAGESLQVQVPLLFSDLSALHDIFISWKKPGTKARLVSSASEQMKWSQQELARFLQKRCLHTLPTPLRQRDHDICMIVDIITDMLPTSSYAWLRSQGVAQVLSRACMQISSVQSHRQQWDWNSVV